MLRGPLRRATVAALALHLAVVVWFARSERPSDPSPVPTSAVVSDDVEVATTLTEEEAIEPEARITTAIDTAPSRVARRETAEATAVIEPMPSASGAAMAPGESVERSTDWVVQTGAIDLAIPKRAFAPGGALHAAPSPGEHAAMPDGVISKSGGLVEGLDARDTSHGLGRSGPVLSAVTAAAHDPAAPVLGGATFSVRVLSGGKIVVDTLDASSEREAWQKLAPIIRQGLADKTLRIPTTANGIRVTVRVEAKEQFAGGGRPTPDAKQGFGGTASIGKIEAKKDHVDIQLPHASIGYQTRSCGFGLAMSPGGVAIGGGCAPGVAIRVVETHLVGEERL